MNQIKLKFWNKRIKSANKTKQFNSNNKNYKIKSNK